MKYTLLRMVQLILSSIDGEEVNSIADNPEAQQIVDIIETVYNDICTEKDLPEHWDFIKLEPSNDPSKPTLMKLPEGVQYIDYIQYDISDENDTQRNIRDIQALPRKDFFRRQTSLLTDKDDIYTYTYTSNGESYPTRGWADRDPTYYTVIADKFILFDDYDKNKETTLQSNKTICYGKRVPLFKREDNWTPAFDAEVFSFFFNEVKSTVSIDLRQVENAKAERKSQQAKARLEATLRRTPAESYLSTRPNFGRPGRGRRAGVTSWAMRNGK